MKITADGYDAHIKIADTKGTQKVFAGAVTDLCIRHIGKHGTHLVTVAGIHVEPMGIYGGKQSDLSPIEG